MLIMLTIVWFLWWKYYWYWPKKVWAYYWKVHGYDGVKCEGYTSEEFMFVVKEMEKIVAIIVTTNAKDTYPTNHSHSPVNIHQTSSHSTTDFWFPILPSLSNLLFSLLTTQLKESSSLPVLPPTVTREDHVPLTSSGTPLVPPLLIQGTEVVSVWWSSWGAIFWLVEGAVVCGGRCEWLKEVLPHPLGSLQGIRYQLAVRY